MNKKVIVAAVALVAVVALMVGVWALTRPKTNENLKTITVTVAHQNGTDNTFTWQTEATTLAQAMQEKGLLGESVDGMYLTIDGETTDFEENQSWWCLYENDRSAVEGADTLVIQDGDHFRWEYTVGY